MKSPIIVTKASEGCNEGMETALMRGRNAPAIDGCFF
jgi:hypothetical protein